MIVTVNGDQKHMDEGTTVASLLDVLQLGPERLAVELNRRIVRRADWAGTQLAEGDRVEIVNFVGGGSLD